MNIHGWFPLGLISVISLLSKGLSRVFSSTTVQKHQFFKAQPSLWSNSHIHTWLPEKPVLGKYDPLSAKSCLKLSRFVTAFFPRSKSLLILWLQPLVIVIMEPKHMKPDTVSTFSSIYFSWSDEIRCHDLYFLNFKFFEFWIFLFWVLSQTFHSPFTFLRMLFNSSSLSDIKVVSYAYLRLLIFFSAILIPACESSSPAFSNFEPVCCSMSVLTAASYPECRFLRRQIRWSGIPISLRIFHSLLWATESKTLA